MRPEANTWQGGLPQGERQAADGGATTCVLRSWTNHSQRFAPYPPTQDYQHAQLTALWMQYNRVDTLLSTQSLAYGQLSINNSNWWQWQSRQMTQKARGGREVSRGDLGVGVGEQSHPPPTLSDKRLTECLNIAKPKTVVKGQSPTYRHPAESQAFSGQGAESSVNPAPGIGFAQRQCSTLV